MFPLALPPALMLALPPEVLLPLEEPPEELPPEEPPLPLPPLLLPPELLPPPEEDPPELLLLPLFPLSPVLPLSPLLPLSWVTNRSRGGVASMPGFQYSSSRGSSATVSFWLPSAMWRLALVMVTSPLTALPGWAFHA